MHVQKEKTTEVVPICGESLRYQTRQFFSNTTLHGIKYIVEKERPFCEKLMWFSLTSIGAVTTCIIIVSLWEKFQTNPTITGLDTDFHNWDVPFPALTICEVNPINPELLEDYINSTWDSYTPGKAVDFLTWLATLSFKSIAENTTGFLLESTIIETVADTRSAVLSVVSHCDLLFFDCEWKGSEVECCDVMLPFFTEMGFCYAFNSKHSEIAWPWQENTQRGDFIQAYINETDLKLSFKFKSQKDNIFEILIHSADAIPGIDMSSQHSWDHRVKKISFSEQHTYTTEDARKLSMKQRGCVFGDEIALETSDVYTYSACMRQCRMRLCMSYCGCVPHFYPSLPNYKYCDMIQMECIAKNVQSIVDVNKCVCYLGCSQTVYEVERLTDADSSKSGDGNSLEIEFVSWPMVRYKREVLFGWVDLLVSFGGIAGLFLGFSLMTGVEIIYYFTMRACCSAMRDHKILKRKRSERLANAKPLYNLSLVPWWQSPPQPVSPEQILSRKWKVNKPEYSPPPVYTEYYP